MAEYFYHLLAIHHFLDITIYCSQILLLSGEIFATLSGCFLGKKQHDSNHYKRNCWQRNTQNQHADKGTDNGNSTVQKLRNTLADHLTQRINIVRIYRHDITMRMCIKILDRQFFHMTEQVFSHIMKSSLCNVYHDQIVNVYRHYTHCIKHCHLTNCFCKRCKVRMVSQQKWRNIIIDQLLHK